MKLKTIFSVGVAALTMIAVCSTAMADLTVVQKTTVNISKMRINGKPVSAQQLQMTKTMMARMGGMDSVSYYTSTKAKVANAYASTLIDIPNKKMTIFMPTTKTYTTMSLDNNAIAAMSAGLQVSTKDMGATKNILGHIAHLYKYYSKNGTMAIVGYAWIAPDITDTDDYQSAIPSQALVKGVKGLPLKINMTVTSSMFGTIGTTVTVTSISTDPIPESTFDMPSDYKPLNMNMNGLK
jgi:iron uptake system EfeUOB component EfeO/EfeM